MKVLHLIRRDVGGGGRAALRVHQGLRALGVDSWIFAEELESTEPHASIFIPKQPFARKVRRFWLSWRVEPYRDRLGADPGWFEDDLCEFGGEAVAQLPPADLINVHDLRGFMDLGPFCQRIAQDTPVVFTLHTMSPFTGGCVYSGDCRGFEVECGGCPQLGGQLERDLSRSVWRRKHRAYRRLSWEQTHLITPSGWLADQARDSRLLRLFSRRVIPNGLDLKTYAPQDRLAARRSLGLDPTATVVLVHTPTLLSSTQKGFAHLVEALLLAKVRIPSLQLIGFGAGELPADLPVMGRHLGVVSADPARALLYSAADLLAVPSFEGNQPLEILEALACGTPLAAFAAGSILEVVRPGLTGELAPVGNAAALADAMVRIVENHGLPANCRRVAVEEFGLELQAQRYRALYEELLARQLPARQAV